MEVYLGEDLGNFTERDCKTVKRLMDGKSFYRFEVSWSNYAGNCQLIVKTSYKDANPLDVKRMFLSVYLSETANIARRFEIMKRFLMSKLALPDAVAAFESERRYLFYQQDAVTVKQLNMPPHQLAYVQTEQGYLLASIEKRYFDEVKRQLLSKGIEVLKYKIED